MINQEQSNLFYNQIASIIQNSPLQHREYALKLYVIYKNILQSATDNYNQLFSSNYARLVFLIDRLKIDKKKAFYLKKTHYYFTYINRNKNALINNNNIILLIDSLSNLIYLISNLQVPEFIRDYLSANKIDEPIFLDKFTNRSIIPFLQGVFKRNLDEKNSNHDKQILIDSVEYGDIILILNKYWEHIIKLLWSNCTLNIFDLSKLKNYENLYELTSSSIIVIEPDYLIDVTDISECFHHKGSNPHYYFLKKFVKNDVSSSLLLGSIVNFSLDEIITNPLADFEDTFEKAIKYKPLIYFANTKFSNENICLVKDKAKYFFQILQNTIPKLGIEICSVEPSFLSPKYGLQGRLDLLLEYYTEKNRKDIIELKSGKAPNIDYSVYTNSEQIVKTSIWNNHFAQTTCYNILLDSVFKNRTGTSSILYTSDPNNPLRNAPNLVQKKQEVIKLRNIIVAFEREIALGRFSILNDINADKFKDITFAIDDAKEFHKVYNTSSIIEKTYFQYYLKFIINEIYFEKFWTNGASNSASFASLWKDNILEKEESMNILPNLKLIESESDFANLHLVFNREQNNNFISSLRKGDIGILYKIDDNSFSITNSQILKCYIKDITPEKVTISLRNKQINPQLINKEKLWAIEPDYIDTTNKVLIKYLFRFLASDINKKELILGLKPSANLNKYHYKNNLLTEIQNEIVEKAINAKNYYLIQGPPGTGKTSYILKALLEFYLNNTNDNILILAYTNRAVDEISDSISKIGEGNFYLRLGSKEATDKKDTLIASLAESLSLDSLYEKLNISRVIISTVSSLLMNPELFEIKYFNLAIIDEASQILEPQLLGILTHVEKFIMIGDEKQLPAVVVQPERNQRVKTELLNKIHLKNLGMSLFERLLNICKINNWHHSFGMLTQQARMHKTIQTLVNALFYSGKLIHFDNEWQKSKNISIYKKNDTKSNFLANHRIIFIESDLEDNYKVHHQEARRVALIIDSIMNSYKFEINLKTIGVITPFRAQCSKIYQEINPKYRELINVDTVERFQGSEREIIIISFALNHKFLLKNIQSLTHSDGVPIDRKLNVAITRSKQQLILLGVKEILITNQIFSNMLKYINVLGKIIDKEQAKNIFEKNS